MPITFVFKDYLLSYSQIDYSDFSALYNFFIPFPVSYTHLDVYKRQSVNGLVTYDNGSGTKADIGAKLYIIPVSYTHLDVYKRQTPARAIGCEAPED